MLESLPLLQNAAPASGGNIVTGIILPFGAMAAIMYFLLIRPQQQQRKKHQEMLGALQKGDSVITSGGIIGKIVKIDEKEVRLDLGSTEVRIVRSMIVDKHNPHDTSAAKTN